MTEIKINMSVSIPYIIYDLFLTELERDGFVFVKFGEYSLVLSKCDAEKHGDIILCKCDHPIEIVGTKWQHIELLSLKGMPFDAMPTGQIKYRERCYKCDCVTPTPVEV